MSIKNIVKTSVIMAVIGLMMVASSAAQTKRRAKPTPTPMLTGAEIISQASDQPDQQAPAQNQTRTTLQADPNAAKVKELSSRVKKLEATQTDTYEQRQKRVLMNLDILTRAEQRSETLRKQLFDLMEKESAIKTKLDQIEVDIRPEMIERALQISGSMRPEEIREMRRKSLDAERRNLQDLLSNIQSTRSRLADDLDKADSLVNRLRTKLEKEIDDTFLKEEPEN